MALSYKNEEDVDELNNPANRLSASENDAAFDDIVDDYDKMSADPSQENENINNAKKKLGDDNDSGKNIDKARDRENNFSSNISPKNAGNKQKLGFKGFLKKNSKNGILPSSMTVIALLAGIFGIGGVSMNGLMFNHIAANITERFDFQNTSMEIRTKKIWNKKILGETTQGSCQVVKVLCRYSRVSGHTLKQMKKNGILALDKHGKVIKNKKLWPNTRPAKYVFQNGINGLQTVEASDFAKELNENPRLRSKLRAAYNPRWVGFADSVFRKISAKFRVSKDQGKLNAKDKKAAKKSLGEGRGGREGAAGKNAKASAFDKPFEQFFEKNAKSIKAARAGGITSMAIALTCVMLDVPSMISSVSRGLQMVQLIQYAFPFLSVADSIKYGDGNTKDIGILGELLTETVDGKSAMGSYGMKYTLLGDTAPEDDSYKKFVPGGGKLAVGADEFSTMFGLNSDAKKDMCRVSSSPEASAAIAAIWATASGATLGGASIAAAMNYVGGKGMEFLITAALDSGFIKFLVGVVPDSVKEAAVKFLVGDLTEDLSGEAVGNALASGASNMLGQTANAGGNMPMTVDQAVAYQKGTDQVQLAYAEEIRATHSPFDVSTKYTFMGSIVDSISPYYGTINSIGSAASSIGGVVSRSLGTIFNVHAAENSTAEYKMCDIPSIKDSDVAAGPFCNIAYGIPISDLNSKDPEDVADYMMTHDNIKDTGEIIEGSDYEAWLDKCTGGDPDFPATCKISGDDKEMYSNFAIYTVDSRILKSMDDPEETKPQNVGGGDSDSDDSSGTVDGDTKELAQKILDLNKAGKIRFQFTTKSVFEALAAGKKAPVNGTNTSVKSTDVDPKLLQFLVDLVETVDKEKGVQTEINVLTNQTHSATSNHYKGKAVDLGCNIMDYTSIADKIGKKYGISRNPGESCAQSMGHHLHYSTTGR